MISKASFRFAAAASLAAALPSASAAESVKQPTGKWIVHFDDSQCIAERDYGSKDHPLLLVLKQPPLGGVMQVSIVEKGSLPEPAQVDGTVQFDVQPEQKVSVLRFAPKGQGMRIAMMNMAVDQFAPAQSARSLRLDFRGFHGRVAVPQLSGVLDVMNSCVADLREVWNVRESAGGEDSVREDSKGDLRGLFSSDDYPWDALMAGKGGSVKIGLLVDERGNVADCSVLETSGVAMLDAQSCSIVRERARFTPAVGNDGKPAKDAFVQRIVWQTR